MFLLVLFGILLDEDLDFFIEILGNLILCEFKRRLIIDVVRVDLG